MGPIGPRLRQTSEAAAFVVVKLALAIYRSTLGVLFRGCCRFVPSCSVYCEEAIRQHGLLAGIWLSALRLARCHPFATSGFDPVPPSRDERKAAADGAMSGFGSGTV